MRRCLYLALCSLCFGLAARTAAQLRPNSWCYHSPVRDAGFVPPGSGLIFRTERPVAEGIDERGIRISVFGGRSGFHAGRLQLLNDRTTIIFKPVQPFSPGETVKVRLDAAALGLPALEYAFTVSDIGQFETAVWAGTTDNGSSAAATIRSAPAGAPRASMSVINGVAVPSDFPKFTPGILKGTAPGKLFLGNWSWTGDRHYMMILENDGTPYFYRRLPNEHTRDFKVQPTGTLTRRVYDGMNCFVEMDAQYNNIDTLRCGKGYGTDEHEVQLLPNHHFLLIGLDYHQVDMSKLVAGGAANATVVGNTVQELDEHHNVVFEWRSWDNYDIRDAVHENLKAASIDYVHMNSVAVDYDGNLIVSSRHLSEVTKIDRKTGKIIWRLGGAHNQFRFANDAYGFSYQHDARPVPGKPNAYTMMDNGNYHTPAFSRAVEFQLDTVAMIAIKVWEYRHKPSDYYSYFMGNVQRLSNGNTYINWGDAPVPKATEVTSAGEVVYEGNFEKSALSYRAFRFEWASVVKVPYLVAEASAEKITLIFNKFGDTRVQRYIVYAGTAPGPTTPIDSSTQTWIDLTKLTNNQTYYFRVTARDSSGVESPFSNEEKMLVKIYPPGINLVNNGTFAYGMGAWQFTVSGGGAGESLIAGDEFAAAITNGGTQASSVQLTQAGIALATGKQYLFEFDAYASNARTIDARVEQSGGAGANYSKSGTLAVTKVRTHKAYPFTMTAAGDPNARVTFSLGMSTDTVRLANISLKQVVPSAVAEILPVPTVFSLDQNYPNPFNPATTIKFSLPGGYARFLVSMHIYDMLGREAAELMNEEKAPGAYSIRWNAADRASGIYYCVLDAQPGFGLPSFHAVKKIVLLK